MKIFELRFGLCVCFFLIAFLKIPKDYELCLAGIAISYVCLNLMDFVVVAFHLSDYLDRKNLLKVYLKLRKYGPLDDNSYNKFLSTVIEVYRDELKKRRIYSDQMTKCKLDSFKRELLNQSLKR